MDNPDNKPDSAAGASGDPGFSQADIDALLSGGSGGADDTAAPSASTEPAPDAGGINQSDIDALLSATEDASDAGEGAAPTSTDAPSAGADERLDTLGRPFDDAAAMMQAAIEEEKAAAAAAAPPQPPPTVAAAPPSPPPPPPPGARPAALPDLDLSSVPGVDAKRVTMLNDVKLGVRIELGRTRMLVEEVLRLGEGSVVELNKLAGDPVDVYVNDRLVARGEVLVLNDNFCVRISDVMSHDPHRIMA